MTDEYLIGELSNIKNRFSIVIQELERKNGIIDTKILDLIDDINKLSTKV